MLVPGRRHVVDPAAPLVRVCFVCRRVEQVDGSWAAQRLGEDEPASHGLCRECFERRERM